MRVRTRRVAGRVGSALGTALVLGASSASAADFVARAFPVPVGIELQPVRSSMALEFEIQRYGVPFDTFATRPLDAAETAFRDFMTALRAGDAARLALLRPGDRPADVQRVIDDSRPGFLQPIGPRVIARIPVGDAQEFVWEWPRPGDPAPIAFTVLATPTGPRVEVVTSARPLETLILYVLQQEARQPQAYAPADPGRYRYAVPLGTPKKGAHPVVLHFDGQPLDVTVMGAERVASAAAPGAAAASAAVFETAYRALEDKNLEGYWGAYTERSRDKLRAWIEGMSPSAFSSFLATTVKPRKVHFLLDADPVALLFYTVEGETRLRYEYLLKTSSGYKLTNAYFEGFLDDVLRDRALFPIDLESFRKGVLAASNPK